MNPLDLKVGDIVTCSTMPNFIGRVESIEGIGDLASGYYSEATLRALCPYRNHEGIQREKGNTFRKPLTSDGWMYYEIKPKEYLVFQNPNLKEG